MEKKVIYYYKNNNINNQINILYNQSVTIIKPFIYYNYSLIKIIDIISVDINWNNNILNNKSKIILDHHII